MRKYSVLSPLLYTQKSSEISDNKTKKKQEFQQLIVDTDAGTDDAWALFMLIQAHNDPNIPITIEAITCVHGNTNVGNVTKNVTRTLQTVNEINIPVYRGAESALSISFFEDPPFMGEDGFGDADLPPIVPIFEDEHAVHALVRLLEEQPGAITIVALGPLTNLALAILLNPKLHNCPREIFILGGNTKGKGNSTVCGEFNFLCDAEAARTVLESFTCPITIVPLETWEGASSTHEFRTEVLGKINSSKIDLLNKIEAKNIDKFKDSWVAADPLIAAIIINPKVATNRESIYCTVELQGCFTRAMMVVDRHSKLEKPSNATVISAVDTVVYEKMLVKTAAD